MNKFHSQQLQDLVDDYIRNDLHFENWRIDGIEPVGEGEYSKPRCNVRVSLRHSQARIDELIAQGNPAEAEIRRIFLADEFKVVLTVEGDKVIDIDWENIQLS